MINDYTFLGTITVHQLFQKLSYIQNQIMSISDIIHSFILLFSWQKRNFCTCKPIKHVQYIIGYRCIRCEKTKFPNFFQIFEFILKQLTSSLTGNLILLH